MCTIAIASGQFGVVIIFTLSVEKVRMCKNPLRQTKLSAHTLTAIFATMWLLFITLCLMFNFVFKPKKDDTCFLMVFNSEETKQSPYLYVLLVFLLLVVLLLTWTLVNNVLTLYYIVESRKRSGRKSNNKEKSMIVRTILVSLSNFISWALVVPVVCLSVGGYEVGSLFLAYVAVVGLPFNSILNPVLYTLTTSTFKQEINKLLLNKN